MQRAYSLRSNLKPGDLGSIVHLHGVVYAREHGWDHTFEAYVAGPLAHFVRSSSPRQRLWIADHGERIVGSIAIVAESESVSPTAQLRWFLVDPAFRGMGIGKSLLHEAVAFSKACGYRQIVLWTERSLAAAASLYRSVGFERVQEKPGRMWGADVIEEMYVLRLN